jgi:uncharacterized flavoprotein (TIGR03862 family)
MPPKGKDLSMTGTAQGFRVAVIGGGPAGLAASEVLAGAGVAVDLYDAMPTMGRKFLMAGRGGLNLTHAEPEAAFRGRYGVAAAFLKPVLDGFGPQDLRAWAAGLGVETFIGTSGRVFPRDLKASGLLRAWLARLTASGVALHPRVRWRSFDGADGLVLHGAGGASETIRPDAAILALGGATWPRLGSDGAWVPILAAADIAVTPMRPANCGFRAGWSAHFAATQAGQPLKTVAFSSAGHTVMGEAMVTADGIEGGAVYALGALLRDAIERDGAAELRLDLKPGLDRVDLAKRLAQPRRGASFGNFLRKAAGLSPVAVALLRELVPAASDDATALVAAIKALPLRLTATAGMARAISSAGGIALHEIDRHFMLQKHPGLFVAGEMLDWEAPTGGYLLQACFATGRAAGQGVLDWLRTGERPGRGLSIGRPCRASN